MTKYRVLALEAEAADEELPGEDVAVDPVEPGIVDAAATDSEDDDGAADEPIELPDLKNLEILRVEEMQKDQDREDKTRKIHAVLQDGYLLMGHLETANEHYRQAAVTRQVSHLKLAAEELQVAQDILGLATPESIEVPLEAGELDDAQLSAALEGLSSTITAVIKAIIELVRKALALLRQFFLAVWRQLRSLDSAIKVRSNEILALRNQYRKGLDERLQAGKASGKIDLKIYVQVGAAKAYLCVGGKAIGAFEDLSWEGQFQRLGQLISSARFYDSFMESLPQDFHKLLDWMEKDQEGKLTNAQITSAFKAKRSVEQFLPIYLKEHAKHVHGESATDQSDLVHSNEYVGNFFQVAHVPNAQFLASEPSLVQLWELGKIVYLRDQGQAMASDGLPFLTTQEIKDALDEIGSMGQDTITAQRAGDRIELGLQKLLEVLKRVDGMAWQSGQSNAELAATKHQQLVSITKAISTIEGNCTRFFSDVLGHTRSVQHAWFQYLTATYERDREIMQTAAPAAAKPEKTP